MARGDVHWFASFKNKLMNGVQFNLSSDTLKMGLVTNTIVPTASTNDPRWGNGGTTDFSTTQIGVATSYTGPITVTGRTFVRSGALNTLDFDDLVVAQDGSGAVNAYYGILYDDTAAGKYCIGFVDLGGPVSLVAGPLNININASGFLTDQSA